MSKTCNNCGTEKNPANVPYVVHESTVARMERIIKRQWIALIVAFAIILGIVVIFTYERLQYDYTGTYEEIVVEQDATDGGNANYIGNDGDIINGEAKDNNTQDNKNTP